jgi:mono/diheme cytochrome c family protein
MDERKKTAGFSLAAGIGGILVLLAVTSVTVANISKYNMPTTEEHTSAVRLLFDTTFHNSVKRQAENVTAPDLTPEMIVEGANKYKATCQHRHAGLGVERSDWTSGMRPWHSHLMEVAPGWEPKEVFRSVKHGVRMSGMLAFGPTHDDQAIWTIAAFVKQLPAMMPERYAALGDAPKGGVRGGGAHGTAPADGAHPH